VTTGQGIALVTKEITWQQFSYDDRLRLRKAYEARWDELTHGERIDPYAIWPHNWTAYMSPIECNVWGDIRSHGLPLYPQLPIGPYFADFASPSLRLVIEVDGRAYHLDKQKDAQRQKYLESVGYEVHRVDGHTTFADVGVLEEKWAQQELDQEQIESAKRLLIERGCAELLVIELARGVRYA
jgi:very-short-patch-repair endonuclease